MSDSERSGLLVLKCKYVMLNKVRKNMSDYLWEDWVEKFVPCDHCLSSLSLPRDAKQSSLYLSSPLV